MIPVQYKRRLPTLTEVCILLVLMWLQSNKAIDNTYIEMSNAEFYVLEND